MEVGIVHKIDLCEEMQQAYLDYAMSVIVSRALPDARDGLKPVHRRILHAMYDLGLRPDSNYKKSARIVGEVLGKYHPHGDVAVYDAMARMAQDFSMRYPLIDGQGNFGSMDGDPPAAMRYTEARITAPATHMMADIGKNTVDFSSNFDDTLTEPTVLPASIPNLLVNGATGIAVGMATSIPPHNLTEVVNASQYMLKNWNRLENLSVENLMRFVQGPDFPTGGIILQSTGADGLISAYSTGRGRITVQARAHLEEMGRGRNRIIVSELPYMTNKSSLIERIADLAREEKIEGIVDLRDESDRQGMRIVIELSKNADPEAVLRDLYKHTSMQNTFSMIILALVNGEPRLLSLKQALKEYIEHRLEIVRRRSQHDLDRARHRAHVLEGLLTALQNLDEIVDIIRRSRSAETAHTSLRKRFKLSDIQAQAILDMPLRRLAALERKKIETEYKEVLATIRKLESLLRSPKKMRTIVAEELEVIKEQFGDRRRTHIVQLKEGQPKISMLTTGELVPQKAIWVLVTSDGLISRTLEDKQPRISGREAPGWLVKANTRDTMYLVCADGKAAAIPVHAVPEAENPSDGTPLTKITPLAASDNLVTIFTLPSHTGRNENNSYLDEWFILTATQKGFVKKSPLRELPGASAEPFTLVRVNEKDSLGWLHLSNGENDILLLTTSGMAIRFNEAEVRPMGLVAAGVMGIKLQSPDEVIGMELLPNVGEIFMVSTKGKGKRVKIEQFPRQGRYGQGVVAWKLEAQDKVVGMTIGKGTKRVALHLTRLAPKAIRLDTAPIQGRTSLGRTILELSSREKITLLTTPREQPRLVVKRKRSTRKAAGASSQVSINKPAASRRPSNRQKK